MNNSTNVVEVLSPPQVKPKLVLCCVLIRDDGELLLEYFVGLKDRDLQGIKKDDKFGEA